MGTIGNLTDEDRAVIRSTVNGSLLWCLAPWIVGPRTLGAALCATASAEYGGPGVAGAVGEWGFYQFNGENRDKYVPGWDSSSPPDLAAQTEGAIRYVRDQGLLYCAALSLPWQTLPLIRGAWLLSLWDDPDGGISGALERGREALETASGRLAQAAWDEAYTWVVGQIVGAVLGAGFILAGILAYFGALRWAGYLAGVTLAASAAMAVGGVPGVAGAVLLGAGLAVWKRKKGKVQPPVKL